MENWKGEIGKWEEKCRWQAGQFVSCRYAGTELALCASRCRRDSTLPKADGAENNRAKEGAPGMVSTQARRCGE